MLFELIFIVNFYFFNSILKYLVLIFFQTDIIYIIFSLTVFHHLTFCALISLSIYQMHVL
jgi:hypothetical protein